ncbi:MAG TPA: methylmalonyl Co-A mutase-associated GTPase MeaB [Nitrososphaeria archaeon]|nr:methylmalonyl Co-A mutase-associated GTPase MeaB [Nitrososphaeria archaeon]
MSLVEGILRGDPAAVSRAITILESDPRGEAARRILDAVSSHGGKAAVVGVTGPPGVGKSTLIGRLCDEMASRGRRVSVLAIDASSPFSGGAFLGNRVRMEESLHRHGIFMRSIAARGSTGGLGGSVWGALRVLSAAGYERVIVETVGAGQSDVDVMGIADVVLVVVAPGFGDLIQALKAGILEIADAFVVNKSDLQGAEELARYLEEVSAGRPVLSVSAASGDGVRRVVDYLEGAPGPSRRDERAAAAVRVALEEILREEADELMNTQRAREILEEVASGGVSPRAAAEMILALRHREK